MSIVFAQHNVFQDPPFGRLDLISCRNLLIYFQTVLQKNLFSIFHVALKDGGYLFLGKSESVGEYSDVFRTFCANEKIFVHHASGKKPPHSKIPYSMQNVENNLDLPAGKNDRRKSMSEYRGEEVDMHIFESLMPACIVVDAKNELKHSFGDCSKFLTIPAGTATLDVFLLLREDLKIAFSTALKEARVTGKRVAYDHIPVKLEDEPEYITVVALPVTDKSGEKTGMTAVAFIRSDRRPQGPVKKYNIDTAAANRISDLEKDLRVAQDSLHQTVMELESVNAELQAANEELLTSNEELQSSNEELQSVNEELYTVNSEYQSKVSEIAAVNDDMANFLSTTLIGIMMVDRDLNIRKYTQDDIDLGQDVPYPHRAVSGDEGYDAERGRWNADRRKVCRVGREDQGAGHFICRSDEAGERRAAAGGGQRGAPDRGKDEPGEGEFPVPYEPRHADAAHGDHGASRALAEGSGPHAWRARQSRENAELKPLSLKSH